MAGAWQEANKYKRVINHQLIEIHETEKGRGIFSTVDHSKGAPVAAFVDQHIAIPIFRTKEEADAFERSKDGEYAVTYACAVSLRNTTKSSFSLDTGRVLR